MQLGFTDIFIDALRNSRHVVALTGAGVSAESGVPTFRGKDGWWRQRNPMELATFEAFTRDPKTVWEWYMYRRDIIRTISPNPGHYALAEMASLFDDFTLITQNVDCLHRDAGSEKIYELHGNIHRNRCIDCGHVDYTKSFPELPPKCPKCNGRFRPDVVWFGEMLPHEAIETSMRATHKAELFFTIGTSGAVQPAASLPIVAKKNGALVVEVNLEPSEVSFVCDIKYHGKSGEILPQIVSKIKELKQSVNRK
jgi:NAD-dependent deacetylase